MCIRDSTYFACFTACVCVCVAILVLTNCPIGSIYYKYCMETIVYGLKKLEIKIVIVQCSRNLGKTVGTRIKVLPLFDTLMKKLTAEIKVALAGIESLVTN